MHNLAFFLIFAVWLLPLANGRCETSEMVSWIDTETGRKVVKVSPQPYATTPYFTANAFSYDRRSMVYISAKGLHLLDLNTFTTVLLVSAAGVDLQCIEMGRKTNRLFYLSKRRDENDVALRSIDITSNTVIEHTRLPMGYRIESINADETLAAGVREELVHGQTIPIKPMATKGEILYERINAKIPMALFTVDLKTGMVRDVHRSKDWLSHPQFSPTDASLLMYSHEGPWHQVDRIWTIRTDGSERKLIHKRSAEMEIAGHEFWSADGSTIHYDWQRPKGETFFFASHQIAGGRQTTAPLQREQWSVHYNSSTDPLLFVGDGANSEQVSRSDSSAGIFLYRLKPKQQHADGLHALINYTVASEKLIDLRAHDYSLEPNARITPDRQWVIFRSNLFGIPAVFAVQISKADPYTEPKRSTFDLATKAQAQRRAILMTD